MQVNKERNVVCKMGLQTRKISVFFATWNVGEYPPGEDGALSDWLGGARDCDLVAVAAQECDYKHRKGYSSCEEDWFMTLLKTLNKRGNADEIARGQGEALEGDERFLVIDGLTMWQMRLIVFTKRKHIHLISDTTKKEEATGIMHVGGNKGGVTIALKFCETPICFVGCHLAAHQGEMKRRAEDINEIIEGVSSFLGSSDMFFNIEYPHVFWAGDLNYRIDTSQDSKKMGRQWVDRVKIRDRPEVISHIEKARELIVQDDTHHPAVRAELRDTFDLLRADDQLLKAMWVFGADRAAGQKQLMPSFVEAGPLRRHEHDSEKRLPGPYFIPTFKVIPRHKSKEEDPDHDAINGYNPERVPAWCDRVLRSKVHHQRCEADVVTERYTMVPSIITSDHKPVSCTFNVNVREQYLFSPGGSEDRDEVPRCGRSAEPRLIVQLSDLSADGLIALDPDGKSDPYVQVVCNFSTQRPQTRHMQSTLTPHWSESLALAVEYGDRGCLDTEYLYFLLYDHDTITRDDILGQSVVSLRGKVGEPGEVRTYPFEADVFLLGNKEGRLMGSITVGEVASQQVYEVARTKDGGRHKVPLLAKLGARKAARQASGALRGGSTLKGATRGDTSTAEVPNGEARPLKKERSSKSEPAQ